MIIFCGLLLLIAGFTLVWIGIGLIRLPLDIAREEAERESDGW